MCPRLRPGSRARNCEVAGAALDTVLAASGEQLRDAPHRAVHVRSLLGGHFILGQEPPGRSQSRIGKVLIGVEQSRSGSGITSWTMPVTINAAPSMEIQDDSKWLRRGS
jgi:hypothetical protein